MSKAQKQAENATTTETTSASDQVSVLDQILDQMPKSVKRDRASELIKSIVEEAVQGQATFDKSVTKTIVRVEKPTAVRFAESVGVEIERSRNE